MKNSSLFIILQRMRKPFIVIIITHCIAIVGLLIIDAVDVNGQPYQLTIFDAVYFVSYMATTIGFGETPFEFTYSQRLWVLFSIYMTVLGWFYGIGSLVSLLQDKLFLQEIEKTKFKKQIKNLKEKFIIILGYDQVTSEIIQKALDDGIRAVVIETDRSRVNDLILESFTPTVPCLLVDSYNNRVLEFAGIKKKNCKAIVCLFESDELNLRVSLLSKLLNKNVKVVAKSTTETHTQNLKDLDIEIIANPFSIISSEVNLALTAPNLLKIEKWLYGLDNLHAKVPVFPKGNYIICGFGRMGRSIYKKLQNNNVSATLIELDTQKVESFSKDEINNIIFGNADDKQLLTDSGVNESVAIIACTNNDTINLSILATAKKINPQIITIARENDIDDLSIFESANINHLFMPAKILINKTTNALINPLSDKFIRTIIKKDESFAANLVKDLVQEIDENPLTFEITLNEQQAPTIHKFLKDKGCISLELLTVSLHNQKHKNNVIPLLLQKSDGTVLIRPSLNEQIHIDDEILFACDEYARNDIEYICNNEYEFHYALTGREKGIIFKRK